MTKPKNFQASSGAHISTCKPYGTCGSVQVKVAPQYDTCDSSLTAA